MIQKTNIEQLIPRYLNGDCSAADMEKVGMWLEESDSNKKIFYEIKDVWDMLTPKEDDTGNALLQFYKKQAYRNNTLVKVLRLWKVVAGVAAVFVLGFICLFFLDVLNQKPQDLSNYSAMVSFKVPLGSRSEVTLSDGTNVVLNSGSELIYPAVFAREKREISLSGEAFFKVKSDTLHPFIVKTNDFDVKVTGTQFNICSYPDDTFSKVSLVEGRVGVLLGDDENTVDIVPGEQLCLNKEERKYQVVESDVEMESSWKDGEFRFKEIAFPELIKRLERWYDVKLSYSAPELEKMLYSGNFRNQETIWQVLDALKLTTPIDYEKIGFRKFKIIYKVRK